MSKSIIEKLGIKADLSLFEKAESMEMAPKDFIKLRKEWEEMLESLIYLVIDGINDKYNEIHPRYSRHRTDEWISRHSQDFFGSEIKIIEKACYPKKWGDIKGLL